ncbi:DUF4864 domain-containing protein [Polymorphum gilvum]|uniref:DUF4864 domain-containing protein n=1 Tax=Polymorphum gilvum (strain LMG 25793 / CGMCC 1.9160 / SL003B-26A1) TaxID=991905 RepID=F2IZS6_POLGS|nr:DUF4864 domain-containing protein [Polymorphum gilvum]ADZ70652.1 hypothetical protein SL003B_2227 [Polymorphum gilvum SL003B-26A1]
MRFAAFVFVWVAFGALGALTMPAAVAAESETIDGAAFRRIVQDQMAAFRRNDAAGAYALATPGLQREFHTPEIFMAMVRQGYMPVYRPKSVSFGRARMTPHGPVQEVFVVGPDGEAWLALYSFARQDDGVWRISGCILRKDKGFQT